MKPGVVFASVFTVILLLAGVLIYQTRMPRQAVSVAVRKTPAIGDINRPKTRILSESPESTSHAPKAVSPQKVRNAAAETLRRLVAAAHAGNESLETTGPPNARFIVQTDRGVPIAGASVVLNNRTRSSTATLTDENGIWETHLKPGDYTAGVQLPEPQKELICKRVPFNKPEQANVEIVLKCVKSTMLEGVVSNEKGESVANASILGRLRDNQVSSATSGADGYFALRGIPEDYNFESILTTHPDYDKKQINDVTEYEGRLDIVLKRTVVRLEVTDAETSRPVTDYTYRISAADQRSMAGFEPRDWTPVHSPDGSAELTALSLGNMKIDVQASAAASGDQAWGGAFFYNAGRSATVHVRIGNPQNVAGIVLLKSDGSPVPGVAVSMKSGHEFFEDGGKEPRSSESAVSGNDGRFTIEGIGPGKHRLMVDVNSLKEKDVWVENEIWVDVPATGEVTVQLVAGASIHGRVIGPQGAPLSGADVYATSWQSVETDAAGEFTIKQVMPGNQRVFLRHKKLSIAESQDVTVLPGEQKEIVFDLSNAVEVTGRITIDGSPWQGFPMMTFYRDTETRRSFLPGGQLESLGDGKYRAAVPHGNHTLWIYESWQVGWPVGIINRDADGTALVRNFDLHLNAPTALVLTPDEEEAPTGQITFEQRRAGLVHVGLKSIPNTRTQVVVPGIPDGEYRIRYMSKDGLWSGDSEWTEIAPGKENVLLVKLEHDDPGIRVGSWNPGTVAMASRRQTFPVTQHITGPGEYLVTFLWETGFASLDIYSTGLLANGQTIAQDTHQGLSGATNINHRYLLQVPASAAGGNYELEAEIGVGVGKTSYGGIYLKKVEQ